MFRRILLTAALILAAGTAAVASPAGAQNYGGCSATVSDTTPAPGQTITISGTGADASSAITAKIVNNQIGAGTSDATGAFSFPGTVPTTASGTETLKVNCGAGSGIASVTLDVGGSGSLPRTGSSTTVPLTVMALAAIVLGGVAMTAARRRAQTTSV